MHGVNWTDFLRRFLEATFSVHAEEYAALETLPPSASDHLLPPFTAQKLGKTERQLGPLHLI